MVFDEPKGASITMKCLNYRTITSHDDVKYCHCKKCKHLFFNTIFLIQQHDVSMLFHNEIYFTCKGITLIFNIYF
jgi:hypothetical protein